jgi:4-diphosphocytidyl-2-C-methyl-D-erythritol kinase
MKATHSHAPAKINLYLHITGRREDGYHFLDSLVVFMGKGDDLSLAPSDAFSFSVDGPMAGGLAGHPHEDNLAVRAVKELADALGKKQDFSLKLTKNLPIASGIGGGSSDAAAALRLAAEHWGEDAESAAVHEIAKKIGQDVPCCISRKTCYFRETGNVTDSGPKMPSVSVVLVNPGKALPTPSVYKARKGAFSASARLEKEPKDAIELCVMLSERRNDLTDAAVSLMPEIGIVLSAISDTKGCLLSRMSGSGATCFGIYASFEAAEKAAEAIKSRYADWWVVADNILGN